MIKLLTGMLLPKDIVLQGADVAKACETCNKWHQKMHKPQVKAHYATQFNEIVQHDIFFLFDQTFMLLIDECIKYKMGDHLHDKQGPTIVRSLWKLWIRVWGPPQKLLSDQEGGLLRK